MRDKVKYSLKKNLVKKYINTSDLSFEFVEPDAIVILSWWKLPLTLLVTLLLLLLINPLFNRKADKILRRMSQPPQRTYINE